MSSDEYTNIPSSQNESDVMTSMTLIEAVSKACQVVIDVKIPEGQVSPVSHNYLVVTNSGERKSTVDSIVQGHLQDANKKRGDV